MSCGGLSATATQVAMQAARGSSAHGAGTVRTSHRKQGGRGTAARGTGRGRACHSNNDARLLAMSRRAAAVVPEWHRILRAPRNFGLRRRAARGGKPPDRRECGLRRRGGHAATRACSRRTAASKGKEPTLSAVALPAVRRAAASLAPKADSNNCDRLRFRVTSSKMAFGMTSCTRGVVMPATRTCKRRRLLPAG